jgi:hypothetical protein
MNKAVIKNFAIWARKQLISDVRYKARLIGITERGIDEPLPHSVKDLQFFDIGNDNEPYIISSETIEQRKKLVAALKKKEKLCGAKQLSDYKTAFDSLVEETAYTWFNRLIAIRFMEVNQYLPSNLRVLSSGGDKLEPELVSKPFDSGFKFSDTEKAKILKWKDDNNATELFTILFIKQCNELNVVLPELFEKINDYTELLINLNYTDPAGVVRRLITDIPEDDFKEAVEIIGWLYQYYNTEPKAVVDAYIKTGKKVTKKDIPAKTQLFTPDWIVRYMVENSLGRLWIEGHPNEELKKNWKYYLDEAEQEEDVKKQLEEIRREYKAIKPEDIKVIDPCMGSGHILVYMFTVLMQIYESQGYNPRDAAVLILEKNLYGLDIDDRAYQLAYFAVMMKARQFNRRILTENIKPHLYAVQESNGIEAKYLQYFGEGMNDNEKNTAFSDTRTLIAIFNDGKEYGSIIKIPDLNFRLMRTFIEKVDKKGFLPVSAELFPETEQQPDLIPIETIIVDDIQARLNELIDIAEILHNKYHAVVTNPPYMGSGDMNSHLSNFVKREYENSKSDLFAVFIEQSVNLTKKNMYTAMITQHAWMFLSSYEKLREKLYKAAIINMAHLGPRAFPEISGEVVQSTTFVFQKVFVKDHKGVYIRLIDYNNADQKEVGYLSGNNRFKVNSDNFQKISGSPVAYWIGDNFLSVFTHGTPIGKLSIARNGMKTGDNDRFVRLWWEVKNSTIYFFAENVNEAISSKAKWFPYNKGGEFRKWYGNNDFIINWQNCGHEIFNNAKSDGRNVQDYPVELKFSKSISWSLVTTGNPAFRYKINNLSDIAGMSLYSCGNNIFLLLSFCNTKIALEMLRALAPTINFQAGDIARLPLLSNNPVHGVDEIVIKNISLSRTDWDSFETSWDFKRHPLIPQYTIHANSLTLSESFAAWQQACEERFQTLKSNEEELNRIFIEIYGLQDELTPEVEDKDVTVRRADLGREIRSLISYAVGCMFGRYSLDVEVLAYAGGDWDNSKYKTFIPDKNNIIPITDEDYYNDDIVNSFIGFIKTVYGEENLEENLNFIAQAINNRGGNSRDIIRGYFLNDFYKDHVKIYQKRPIYWLLDSGKENGFKALIYMHRYHADTIGSLRIEYLHKMQNAYEGEVGRVQRILQSGSSATEKAKNRKRLEKLQKQLREIKVYDEKIAHLALSRIEIDLDDGVKLNYEKVQTSQDGKKLEVLGKIG